MASLIQGKDVRLIDVGILVTKASSALPLNTAQNLFSVSGGQVFINALVGNVTASLGSTAQTVTLGFTNTATPGATSATCLGTGGTVSNLQVNSSIVANPGGATTISPLEPGQGVSSGVGAAVSTAKAPYLVPPGTVTVTTNANNATGTVQWYLLYTPLDDGASVSSL